MKQHMTTALAALGLMAPAANAQKFQVIDPNAPAVVEPAVQDELLRNLTMTPSAMESTGAENRFRIVYKFTGDKDDALEVAAINGMRNYAIGLYGANDGQNYGTSTFSTGVELSGENKGNPFAQVIFDVYRNGSATTDASATMEADEVLTPILLTYVGDEVGHIGYTGLDSMVTQGRNGFQIADIGDKLLHKRIGTPMTTFSYNGDTADVNTTGYTGHTLTLEESANLADWETVESMVAEKNGTATFTVQTEDKSNNYRILHEGDKQ